jgi:general secretion pathway protein E
VLRQDADVVLIGEIRDEETAKIACQAATTGQLVLSTLHATDPVSAIYRMLDLNVAPYNLASAIRGVVSQQLFRKLCQECRIEYTADDTELKRLALPDGHGPIYTSPDSSTNTCLNCNGKGFVGRTGVFGLLEVTPAIRELIRDSAGVGKMASVAREHGLTTVRDDCVRLLLDGAISPQEFHRVIDEN